MIAEPIKRRCDSRISSLFALTALVLGLMTGPPGLANESAEDLFPNTGVQNVRISPDAKWVVGQASFGLRSGVLVQRLASAQTSTVFATRDHIESMTWADHRTLIVEIHTSLERLFMLIRFDYENGQVVHEKRNIRTSGWLVDPRPLVEDEVIWAFNFRGRASLHRVSLEELENHEGVRSARGRIVLPGEPLADFAGPADRWVVDREGAVPDRQVVVARTGPAGLGRRDAERDRVRVECRV